MIRKAVESDFEPILDLCEEFWKHTQFSEPFERDHTIKFVEMAYEHGLLAVLELDGINGFVAGIKSYLLGSTQALTGTELAWWVNPEYRKGRRGIELMRFIEKLAKNEGIKYWNMASMQSSSPETANRIYTRLGYKLSESLYTKEI